MKVSIQMFITRFMHTSHNQENLCISNQEKLYTHLCSLRYIVDIWSEPGRSPQGFVYLLI